MIVVSLGGSIVAPDRVDTQFVSRFAALAREVVATEHPGTPGMVVVVGGGGPARAYQQAYRAVAREAADNEAGDWIGIMATRLNAELMRHALAPACADPVIYDPTNVGTVTGSILVAAGWKPGWSTDYDAVLLAEHFGAQAVVNLSNIAQVHSADPKVDPSAQPLESISWADFRLLVGEEWTPGRNVPFDPVATRRAAELGLTVIAAAGTDLDNTRAILTGGSFTGTTIHP